MVFEHMPGKDLFDYLRERKFCLSESRTKEIIRQIGEAVSYLQNFGVIHRDLKLENVMMSDFS
jgi:serine/threonine protein kinase